MTYVERLRNITPNFAAAIYWIRIIGIIATEESATEKRKYKKVNSKLIVLCILEWNYLTNFLKYLFKFIKIRII